MENSALRLVFLCFVSLLLVACNSNDSDVDTNDGSPESLIESLIESLNALGVDTTDNPRADSQGNPFPSTYAPLGDVVVVRQVKPPNAGISTAAVGDEEVEFAFGRPEEIFLGGFRLSGQRFYSTVIDDINIQGLAPTDAEFTVPVILEGLGEAELVNLNGADCADAADMPSAVRGFSRPQFGNSGVYGARRDAIALDVNGNNFLETVIAYLCESTDGTDQLRLQIIYGDGTSVTDIMLSQGGIFLPGYDISVAGGDFDGDGLDEIAIGVTREQLAGLADTPVGIYVVDDEFTGFQVLYTQALDYRSSFPTSLGGPDLTVKIADFHADHDNREEIAVVVNETSSATDYAANYFVLAIEGDSLVELSSGPITATVIDTDGRKRSATAVVANIATDDINGDSLDELIFAGFEAVVETCREIAPGDGGAGSPYFLAAYGGRHNNFTPVLAGVAEIFNPFCGSDSGSVNPALRYAHVNVLDFDDDGDMDIQVNDMVLEKVPVRNWNDNIIARITDPHLIYSLNADRRYFDRSKSAMAISDQTGDGIKNIISVYMNANDDQPFVRIYGWDPASNDGYRLATKIRVENLDLLEDFPQIVPMDVDNDKVAVYRYTGDYFLDFVEPIPLAAIAAAPCRMDVGQDNCSSSWGQAQSGSVGRSFFVEAHGCAGGGVGFAGGGVEFSMVGIWCASASKEQSAAYELTMSRTFSTGPFEDGIVFTALPIDRYMYELLTDSTDQQGDPGDQIEVTLPRSPDMRIVERTYYNASITEDSVPIGSEVFSHVPGDIFSYPDVTERDLILENQRSLLDRVRFGDDRPFSPEFKPLPADIGLTVGPVRVGQGEGATELALEYTEIEDESTTLALAYSAEFELAFGAKVVFEVGFEKGRTLTVSHGDTSLFSGSVDSISTEFYSQYEYGFGLFAYVQSVGDHEIEVVNFWVDE